MKLSKAKLFAAPVCSTCVEGSIEPQEIAIVERQRGWVHVLNNKQRCPGQGDDNTDDRAVLLTTRDGRVTVADVLAGRY